jgi:hypothetical protein
MRRIAVGVPPRVTYPLSLASDTRTPAASLVSSVPDMFVGSSSQPRPTIEGDTRRRRHPMSTTTRRTPSIAERIYTLMMACVLLRSGRRSSPG